MNRDIVATDIYIFLLLFTSGHFQIEKMEDELLTELIGSYMQLCKIDHSSYMDAVQCFQTKVMEYNRKRSASRLN